MRKILKNAWLRAPGLALGMLMVSAASGLAQDAPVAGGVLTYLEQQAHYALYPPTSGFYPNSGVLNQVLDRLTYQDPATLEVLPWIAESWEINDMATEYTFKLRPGVTFSDGSPLDAEAVAANYDTYGLGKPDLNLVVSEVVNNFERSEVIDPLTVKFVFKAPAPGFLQATSVITSGLVSKATLALPLEHMGDATKIVGSGPFVVESEILGKEMMFKAREDYDWAPPSLTHQGRALLDGIHLIVTPEDGVRVGALLAGQGDVIRVLQPYDEPQVDAMGYQIIAGAKYGISNALYFRPDNPLLSDVRVRRALIAATNRPEIIATIFSERYPLATSVTAAGVPGYVDLSEKLAYDPELAKALFAEAGWAVGASGLLEKDGLVMEMTIYEAIALPQNKAMLQLIAQQWAPLGIKLTILPGDAGSRAADNLNPYKTTMIANAVGRSDPDAIKGQFHPANRNNLLQVGGLGKENVKSFIDPELNAMLESIASDVNPESRFATAEQVQRHIIDQAYIIPIFEDPQMFAAAPYVRDFIAEATGRPQFYGTWLAAH